MYPFREIHARSNMDTEGMYYMASPPQDIEGAGLRRQRRGDLSGPLDFLEEIAHDIASPFRGAMHLAEEGAHELAPLARGLEHAAMVPLRLLRRGVDAVLPGPVTSGVAGILEDTSGFSLHSLTHAITQPFRSVAHVAEQAAVVPFQIAERAAMAPLRLAQRAAGALLPGAPGGGGGAPAAPAPDPSQDPSQDQSQDPGDGGGDASMYDGTSGTHHGHHHHGYHRRGGATVHGALSDYLPSWMRSKGAAGKLLVSAVPGGATALEARDIANKALANGDLKPEHVTAASKLLKLAHLGHKGSLQKIAGLKHAAGKGDPHAEVAMDRLKLVHSLHQGGGVAPTHTSTFGRLHDLGLATLRRA